MKALKNILLAAVFAAAVMLIPAFASLQVNAAGEEDYIEYTGEAVSFLKDNGEEFGMFRPQEGTTIALEGENVVIHYVPNNKVTYKWIHWGKIDSIEFPYTVAEDDLAINDDGSMDITLPKSVCGYGLPVAPIHNSLSKTTSAQYYLVIPPEKVLTREPLAITNNVNMFKLETAFVGKDSQGTYLTFTLSGTGYHYLYKGDYEQASANGDNRDNWVAGFENADEKWQFELKIEDGETFIPVVAISQSYLEKYEKGQNKLERAFYPRQLTLDFNAKTVVSADYQETVELTIENSASMFKPGTATLTTTGGPNSNGYTVVMDLFMDSESLDAAFLGEQVDAEKEGAEIIPAVDGNHFTMTVEKITTPGNTDSIISVLNDPTIITFRSKKNQTWKERKALISKADRKLTFFESADADYSAVDAALATIPESLDIYTEKTAAAVTAAKDAVVTGKNFLHQAEVDAMAAAINDAVSKLVTKDQQAANDVQDLIDKANANYKTAEEKQKAIDAAKAALDKLTPEQRALIPDADADIEKAQKAADTQKKAEKDAAEKEATKKGTVATVGGFVYKITGAKTATLVKPAKKAAKATIPGTVKISTKTFTVNAISAKAFKGNAKLKTLSIGKNVKTIGASAFEGCKKLAKVNIPAGVATIGKAAFKNCAAAKSITLGKGVKTINASAFEGCKKATKLTIQGKAIKTFGKKSFSKTGIKKFTAPKAVKAKYKKKLVKVGMKKTAK